MGPGSDILLHRRPEWARIACGLLCLKVWAARSDALHGDGRCCSWRHLQRDLSGQALLAQALPGREEFGGIITNLTDEMDRAGAIVRRNLEVTVDTVWEAAPDTVGRIAAVGDGVDPGRIGERVMVDSWLRDPDHSLDIEKSGYYGSECDGGFAEYATAPDANAVKVEYDLSDVELATFMVAFSTAEGMISHIDPKPGEWVLVSGASSGLGTAAIQLVKRRGANVIGLCSASKRDDVRALGADAIIPRDVGDLVGAVAAITPSGQVEGVVDVVGGPLFGQMISSLRAGGRYASSGAIGGPEASFNLRHLVYRDLEMHSSTVTPLVVFHDVVRYIEAGEVRPVLSATYPLEKLADAQKVFLHKNYIGKIDIEM